MSDPTGQSFSSHTRWDPIFHFFALPVLLLLFPLYSIVHLVRHPDHISVIILAVALALAVNTFRTRTYPLSVQDRLIGLRFASDGELAELVALTVAEKLPRKEVKRRVKSWRADHRRV